MQIYGVLEKDGELWKKGLRFESTAVALGGFDAIHLGHRAIIQKVVGYAKDHGLQSLVYLFRNQPRTVLTGEPGVYVNTLEQRLGILEELGVDAAVVEWFTPEYQSITPEDFVKVYLRERLGAVYAAAGFNYRFGLRGRGDIETLKHLGVREGILVESMPCVEWGGSPISSTRIRGLIQEGRMESAAACLGRQFAVKGRVVKGNQLGRTIGFPTANLDLPTEQIVPKYGVYVTQTLAEGRWYPSITNVGDKPTVTRHYPCIETHLLDYEGDLYFRETEIRFFEYLRGISKFSGLDALKIQLEQDKRAARRYFGKKK